MATNTNYYTSQKAGSLRGMLRHGQARLARRTTRHGTPPKRHGNHPHPCGDVSAFGETEDPRTSAATKHSLKLASSSCSSMIRWTSPLHELDAKGHLPASSFTTTHVATRPTIVSRTSRPAIAPCQPMPSPLRKNRFCTPAERARATANGE